MPDLSVILCTHNPRPDYLRRTLDSLKAQTLPAAQWELLFIDNASKDRLAGVWDIAWHPRGRHVREEELGIVFARLRGISESRGEWVVYVDDDNVFAPDYLENVLETAARHPYLGAFGAGILEPEFEVPPPSELSGLMFMLALRSVSSPHWSNNPQDAACCPYGAGLCVRRDTTRRYVQITDYVKTRMVVGRKGKRQLFQHEDDLFSWAAVESGAGFGIFPELRITHLISAGRLEKNYLLRLIFYGAISHWGLQYLLAGARPQKITLFRIIHVVLHGMRNGLFSMQCQWARARGEDRAARNFSEKPPAPMAIIKKPDRASPTARVVANAGTSLKETAQSPPAENWFQSDDKTNKAVARAVPGKAASEMTPSKKIWGVFTRKERWGLSWRGGLIFIVASLCAAGFLLRNIQPFLAKTQRVDTNVLVVEGWVHEYTIRAAVKEFKAGSYRRIFTTGGPVVGTDGETNDFNTLASVGAELLKKAGVPDGLVQMVPAHAVGRDRTYSSAIALRDWFRQHNISVRSINVVTEDAHARRTQLLFQEAFGRGVAVGVISIPDPDYDPRHWWRSSEGVREVLDESIAYIYARIFFHPPNG